MEAWRWSGPADSGRVTGREIYRRHRPTKKMTREDRTEEVHNLQASKYISRQQPLTRPAVLVSLARGSRRHVAVDDPLRAP